MLHDRTHKEPTQHNVEVRVLGGCSMELDDVVVLQVRHYANLQVQSVIIVF